MKKLLFLLSFCATIAFMSCKDDEVDKKSCLKCDGMSDICEGDQYEGEVVTKEVLDETKVLLEALGSTGCVVE